MEYVMTDEEKTQGIDLRNKIRDLEAERQKYIEENIDSLNPSDPDYETKVKQGWDYVHQNYDTDLDNYRAQLKDLISSIRTKTGWTGTMSVDWEQGVVRYG